MAAEGLKIRTAVAEDVEAIHAALVALARATGGEADLTSTAEDIRAHGFGADPAFEALIAEIDGGFAGLAITFPIFSTWRGERGVYVQDLYVEAALRGRGVGEALLREVARRARARGAGYLSLSVDAGNAAAQAFYARLGIPYAAKERLHLAKGAAFAALAGSEDPEP